MECSRAKTYVAADFASDDGVVSCEDFDVHALVAQESQRFGGGFLGRVEEGDKPEKMRLSSSTLKGSSPVCMACNPRPPHAIRLH